MLGGNRRIWPSLSAYLMTQQHAAHRSRDMERVWALRRMRFGIRRKLLRMELESVRTGEALEVLTEADALEAVRRELREAEEELAQCKQWKRPARAREIRRTIEVINEVIQFWEAQLDTPC